MARWIEGEGCAAQVGDRYTWDAEGGEALSERPKSLTQLSDQRLHTT